jgi:hypothetical protein
MAGEEENLAEAAGQTGTRTQRKPVAAAAAYCE